MHVLVTGAGGFVGTTLCESLVSHGARVRAGVHSLEPGCPRPSAPGLELVRFELAESHDALANCVAGVDAIVHLAAKVHSVGVQGTRGASYRDMNTTATESLARAAAASGARRFVFLSSAKVFAEHSPGRPFTEEDAPRPGDPYAKSKWEAEQALQAIASETGLEIVILRPPLVYGPRVKANFVALMEAVARGIPLPLASLHNRRSLLGVRNLVDAIETCLEHPHSAGETFVVADPVPISTTDLVREIAAALHVRPRLFPCPVPILEAAGRVLGRSDAVERLVGDFELDAAKLERLLDWHAPVPRAVGLQETAAWYLSLRTNR